MATAGSDPNRTYMLAALRGLTSRKRNKRLTAADCTKAIDATPCLRKYGSYPCRSASNADCRSFSAGRRVSAASSNSITLTRRLAALDTTQSLGVS